MSEKIQSEHRQEGLLRRLTARFGAGHSEPSSPVRPSPAAPQGDRFGSLPDNDWSRASGLEARDERPLFRRPSGALEPSLWEPRRSRIKSFEPRAVTPHPAPSLQANWESDLIEALIHFTLERAAATQGETELRTLETQLRGRFTDPALRQHAIARVIDMARPHVRRLPDPFAPIARGDLRARLNETVLWENERAMVIVDGRSETKALVVPKRSMSFPSDGVDLLPELSQIVRATSEAFDAVTGAGRADVWINPPQVVTVAQMHVHVQPHLEGRIASRDLPRLYQAVSAQLRQRLGPVVAPR